MRRCRPGPITGWNRGRSRSLPAADSVAAADRLVTGPGLVATRDSGSLASSNFRRALYRSRGENPGSGISPTAPQLRQIQPTVCTQHRPWHSGHAIESVAPLTSPENGSATIDGLP